MAESKRSKRIWDFLLIFAVVYLASQYAIGYFFPKDTPVTGGLPVTIRMQDSGLRLGQTPVVIIENNTSEPLDIANRCPLPPVDVFRVGDGNQLTSINTPDIAVPCETVDPIPAGESIEYGLAPWKQSMFSDTGLFEIELPVAIDSLPPTESGAVTDGNGSEASQYREGVIARFAIEEPGAFTKIFRSFITKPLLNALIFIAGVLPGHSLGWAIVILTLAVKLLLFIPTQHALEGQKKMQLLQPKFEEIRKKHRDDPQKMQAETMKVWKEHKVNPFQACLPMLVQFPVLIGLFYVIRDGVHLPLSQHLIYGIYHDLDWSFDTLFLGFDLNESYPWIFPPILVVLQFIQMKLSFHIADKKKAKEIEKKTTKAVDTPQEVQQKMMLYVLPLLIGFFSFRYPSALSLYWGISTVFAIGQQMIVNREHLRV